MRFKFVLDLYAALKPHRIKQNSIFCVFVYITQPKYAVLDFTSH